MAREFIRGPFTLASVDADDDNPANYLLAIDTPWGKGTFIASRRTLNFWWNSGGEVGVPSRHERLTMVTLHLPRITWFRKWVDFNS